MASSASRVAHRRHVHVHGAEVSTDGDALGMYAEAIALTLALFALLAAVWVAATPSEGADLTRNTSLGQPSSGEFVLAPEGTAYQPDPDGPSDVAVIGPGGAATGPVTFGDPFGTGLGATG